jgi:hypothetical protein
MSAVDDERAAQLVIGVLGDKAIGAIDFNLDGRKVTPAMYAEVAKAIKAKKITVMADPSLVVAAAYSPEIRVNDKTVLYDVMILKQPDLGSDQKSAFVAQINIVHEATHAGFDLMKTPNMLRLHHEAAAYVAGFIFAIHLLWRTGGDPAKVTWTNPIETAAWEIAWKISTRDITKAGPPFSKSMLNTLYTEIGKSDLYKGSAQKKVINDGVGRAWIVNGKKIEAM